MYGSRASRRVQALVRRDLAEGPGVIEYGEHVDARLRSARDLRCAPRFRHVQTGLRFVSAGLRWRESCPGAVTPEGVPARER